MANEKRNRCMQQRRFRRGFNLFEVIIASGIMVFVLAGVVATGIASTVDEFRPNSGSTGMGTDYALVLSDYASDSSVAVIDAAGNSMGRVKPVFDARRVTIRIPLALIGGDDGRLNAAAIVGVLGMPSDIVPENGHLTSAAGSSD